MITHCLISISNEMKSTFFVSMFYDIFNRFHSDLDFRVVDGTLLADIGSNQIDDRNENFKTISCTLHLMVRKRSLYFKSYCPF